MDSEYFIAHQLFVSLSSGAPHRLSFFFLFFIIAQKFPFFFLSISLSSLTFFCYFLCYFPLSQKIDNPHSWPTTTKQTTTRNMPPNANSGGSSKKKNKKSSSTNGGQHLQSTTPSNQQQQQPEPQHQQPV